MLCKICGQEAGAGEVTCSGCGSPLPMPFDKSGAPYAIQHVPGSRIVKIRFVRPPSELVRSVLKLIGTWDGNDYCWSCSVVTEDELRQLMDDTLAGRDPRSVGGDGTQYLVWRAADTGQVKVKFGRKQSMQVLSVLQLIGTWDRNNYYWTCSGIGEGELRQLVDDVLAGRDPRSVGGDGTLYLVWWDAGSGQAKVRFSMQPAESVLSVLGLLCTWDRDNDWWTRDGITKDELRQLVDDVLTGRDPESVDGEGTPYLIWWDADVGQAKVRFGRQPFEQVLLVMQLIGKWDAAYRCWACGGITEDELRYIMDTVFAGRDLASVSEDGTPYLV